MGMLSGNLKLLLAILSISIAQGCHSVKNTPKDCGENRDVGGCRRKRGLLAEDARQDLSDFFTQCMIKKNLPNLIPEMRAVVDFVQRDTIWYELTDNNFCSGHQDTLHCWNSLSDGLIDWDSPMLGPLRECILEYATQSNAGGYRRKRDIWDERSKIQTTVRPEPPCPQVDDELYGDCIENLVNDSNVINYPSLRNFHWESIAIFLRDHFSRCRFEEFTETWNGNKVVYRKNCGSPRFKKTNGQAARFASEQCIPFLLQEVIKDDSPLKSPNEQCIQSFSNYSFEITEDFVEDPGEQVVGLMTPDEEEAKYGRLGINNGADMIGDCGPRTLLTDWYDSDLDNITGDNELLIRIRNRHPEDKICQVPSGIQMRISRNNEPYYNSGNALRNMSPGKGLECLNSMQHAKPCENFKVRFCCPETNKVNGAGSHPYRKTPTTVGTCGPNDRWGYWKNIDRVRGNRGDFEYFKNYGMPRCEPVAVEGRIRGSNRPYTTAHNNLRSEDPKVGIVCDDNDQPRERPCRDFEVRFCCRNGVGIVAATPRPVTKLAAPPVRPTTKWMPVVRA